ncbi:MAG: spore coat U domain-containing protein [Pseudomonadota bacterium]
MVNLSVLRVISKTHRNAAFAAALGLTALAIPSANAATTTANMNVQLVVQASCAISSVGTLDFGTATTPLTANIDATTTFDVTCSNGTTYDIGLNAGTTAGGTVATRKMFNGGTAEDVDYTMWTNAARTTNWGNTVGTDTQSATGSGSAQTYTVYGRVPPQTTPTPATYTDTVTITVTY